MSFINIAEAVTGSTSSTTTALCSKTMSLTSIKDIINFFSCTLIQSVIPLLFTLATVAFIWGVIKFFLNPENEEKRNDGKTFMIWGIIALFVMISMWGLVGVLSNTAGLKVLIPQLSQ